MGIGLYLRGLRQGVGGLFVEGDIVGQRGLS